MSKVIILSSILKPCDEVRMFERMGRSLAKVADWQIHISGTYPSQSDRQLERIFFYPLTSSSQPKKGRIQRIYKTYQLWKKLHPDVIICTTPELVPAGVLFKWLNGVKLVYDVQEDFEKNITFQRIYVGLKKHLALLYVKVLRNFISRSVDYFFLAEKTFRKDIGYPESRCLVLPNKTADIPIDPIRVRKNHLLFTGIISNYAGIKTAVKFYQSLKSQRPELKLTIAGYCYDHQLKQWLRSLASMDSDIELKGLDQFLSHETIVEQIRSSSLGIICHEYNEVSKDRIPTKLYEYVFYQLPYVIPENTQWEKIAIGIGGAIPTNFDRPDPLQILKTLDSGDQIGFKYKSDQAAWNKEEAKMINIVQLLIK